MTIILWGAINWFVKQFRYGYLLKQHSTNGLGNHIQRWFLDMHALLGYGQ